jgi:TonB-dependent receptor
MNGTLADIGKNTNGTATGDGPSGRGQGMRDLPADLIKSVDVIKGSTADMNEGALGGGVQIKTRNALDFKKRYSSIKLQGTQGSINDTISPAYTVVLADQFMDGRLGVLINASGSKITNEGHVASNTDSGRGYNHWLDLDNSAEKTFSYNPSTLSTTSSTADGKDYATTPFYSAPLIAGGTMAFETPQSFLTKAGAAASKADCYTQFPALSAAQLATITPGASSANLNAARSQRSNELISCLNQWNDWTPQNLRYQVKRDYEDRKNIDLRVDFKVNDDLIVYAKGSHSDRDILNTFETYTLGGLTAINPNPTTQITGTGPGVYLPGYVGGAFTTTAGVISAVPGSGYYTNPNNITWSNLNQTNGIAGIKNNVTNLLPGSVYVDKNHHVTQYSFSNGRATTDQTDSDQHTDIDYLQLGGTYEKDNLTAEFMVGDARSTFTRNDMRINWFKDYGAGTTKLLPGGIWQTTPAEGNTFDQTNPATYTELKAATTATAARFTNAIGFNQQQPRLAETEEITGKVDVTYKFEDSIPFITQVKAGLNYREVDLAGWGNGGGTLSSAVGTLGQPNYKPAVFLGTNNARGSIVGCENTAGSLGVGGVPCAYGDAAQAIQSRDVTRVVNQQELTNLIAASMKAPSASFFDGMTGRGDNFIDGWDQIDVKKFYRLAGAAGHFSLHCIKECLASDGNVYKQPVNRSLETTLAGYAMADFEYKELPMDMELTGNVGVRVVETNATASGYAGFRAIILNSLYDPNVPATQVNGVGLEDITIFQNVSMEDTTRHVLPSFNLGLWAIPDELVVRYSYGKTIARPSIAQLIPSGTCTYDTRNLGLETGEDGDPLDMACGRFGNPKLEAYQNINQNLSLEWYPNKGQMLSVAVFNSKAEIGGGIVRGFASRKIFAGSTMQDPLTGDPLSDVEFAGTTYQNGPGYNNTGFELSSKSAFTFLPWKLKYTGIDLNFTTMDYSISGKGQFYDVISGDKLPPAGLVPQSYNIALWYDDGKVNARLSYQHKDKIFVGMSRGPSNGNYPSPGGLEDWVGFPYNPGAPRFTDAAGFIDAKVTFKYDKNLELFIEGRNLGKAPIISSTGGYYDFEDGTQNVEEYKYFGRKITAGLTYKF